MELSHPDMIIQNAERRTSYSEVEAKQNGQPITDAEKDKG
jgi:hypothetical protein